MAKKWKGKWKDKKKPTAKKPAPKSKKPAAKAKKKRAQHAPRTPFTDSDLTDKDGVKIRDFAAYYAENPKHEDEPFKVYALPPSVIAKEWAEYQKCFYDARNLKKDVLSRKYRPLATILRLVREWAAKRKTRSADWNPIGAPRSHTRAKVAAALSL